MSDFGLDRLAKARKRALLAALLRQRSGLAPSKKPDAARAPIEDLMIALASMQDWNAQEQDPYIRHVAPYKGFLYQRLGMDKTFVRGEGCYLLDADGTRYADFIAQFGAVPFGHDPAPIWQALENVRREALPNLVIRSIPAVAGRVGRAVARSRAARTCACRIHQQRRGIGRGCHQARPLSHRPHRHSVGPQRLPRPHARRHVGDRYGILSARFRRAGTGIQLVPFGDLAALQAAFERRPDFFAAFMFEIIQGESGIRVAPPGYLAAARELCRRFGALLIVDEVQTGLGRTGRLFACEAEGVTPDILALAKALGGGLMPMGACLYTADAYSEHFDLRHGSTFAGNALACRAALATIEELTRDDQRLVRQVAALGERLQQQLRRLQSEYPSLLKEIRGRGLMLGVELDLRPVAQDRSSMLALLQEQGLLLLRGGELPAQRRAHPHGSLLHAWHCAAHRASADCRQPDLRSPGERPRAAARHLASRRCGRPARPPDGQVARRIAASLGTSRRARRSRARASRFCTRARARASPSSCICSMPTACGASI